MINVVQSVFLLLIVIAGNFIGSSLGCQTQKLCSENVYVRHALVFMILYFSMNLSDDSMHPARALAIAFSVMLLFVLFTKMDMGFTFVAFSLLCVIYIISHFIKYYKKEEPERDISKHHAAIKVLVPILLIIILTGFSLYAQRQYVDHKKDWSTIAYIFGKPNCDWEKSVRSE